MLLGMGSRSGASPAISAALVRSTAQIATRFATARPASTTTVASLAKKVLNGMLTFKLSAFLVPAGVLAILLGAGAFWTNRASGQVKSTVPAAAQPTGSTTKVQSPPVAAHRPKLVAPSEVKASTGRGSFLVYALDESGRLADAAKNGDVQARRRRRIVGGGDMFGSYQERLEEHRWVVVTGLLDHDAIRKNLALTDALASRRGTIDVKIHPNYRRLDVERQERRPDGDWSNWAEVDRARNSLILENVPEVESDDRMPEQVRLPALADPLPFLKLGSWTGTDVEKLVSRGKKPPPDFQRLADRRNPFAFPTTEAPEILVRSLDFTVQPGLSYRYRVRIVVDSADRIGQRRELIGPWSDPTAPVIIPQ